MKVKNLKVIGGWERVFRLAKRTLGKEPNSKEPSSYWKAKMLIAEHSPIRALEFDWTWENIPQWVSVHITRHHIGCEKFVHSQREDKRDIKQEYNVSSRNTLPQGSLNDMDMTANAQALINISRKRLCNTSAKETREAWTAVKEEIQKVEPIVADKMVRECVYRGFCPEIKCCGYCFTNQWKEERETYKKTDYDE